LLENTGSIGMCIVARIISARIVIIARELLNRTQVVFAHFRVAHVGPCARGGAAGYTIAGERGVNAISAYRTARIGGARVVIVAGVVDVLAALDGIAGILCAWVVIIAKYLGIRARSGSSVASIVCARILIITHYR